jgi:hypothetical protein
MASVRTAAPASTSHEAISRSFAAYALEPAAPGRGVKGRHGLSTQAGINGTFAGRWKALCDLTG